MQKFIANLTVYYENPFWVGVYEIEKSGNLKVCKITFGTEPKDYEVYEFLNENYKNLKFSPTVVKEDKIERKINPKRLQRLIRKKVEKKGVGTKSQQALKLQQEKNKKYSKIKSRRDNEEAKKRKFQLKQLKKKNKHKGR